MSIGKYVALWKILIRLGLIAVYTIGCGGGGGGGSDTTPPQISSVAPTDSATDITLDAGISATFNEAMDDTTIGAASMTISPAVAGSISYDAAAQRAIFTPAGSLTASTTYTVTVTTGCADMAGNSLAADHTWSFTTGATAVNNWTQVGDQVSPAGAESEDPTVMIVGNSPAVGYRHASFGVNLNHWSGSSWGTPTADPSGGNSNSSIYHAPAFCSNESTIYMAYSHAGVSGGTDAEFYDRIMVYQWTAVGGYSILNSSDEVSVPYNPTDGGVDANEPAIGCHAGALPWVAWEEADAAPASSDSHGWAAEITVGGSSSSRAGALSRNDNAGSYSTDVRTVGVIRDAAGCAYLAQWESHQTEQDQTDLYVSKTCGAGYTTLGGAVTDDWDYNNLSKPSMALLGNQIYIAYTRANQTDNTQHVYVKYFNGTAWVMVGSDPLSAYSAADHYDSGNPDLIVADGTLYAAWEESNQTDGPFIFTAHYDGAASAWVVETTPLNISAANAAQDPSLAYNATDGYLYAAFEENTDGWPHIFVKRKRHIP